jgi:hypothetical protein
MGYADDVDIVREYVRTAGRFDYVRMHEIAPDCVAVEFAFNVERHSAALAAAVTQPSHVRVIAGLMRPDHLTEQSRQYWEPQQDAVFAVWDTLPTVHEISFGYDDEGPFLAVGLSPLTDEERARVTEAFKPHRVRTHHQGPVTPA